MEQVTIEIGPKGVVAIRLRADSPAEEQASWRLYRGIRPVLDRLEAQLRWLATRSESEQAPEATTESINVPRSEEDHNDDEQ